MRTNNLQASHIFAHILFPQFPEISVPSRAIFSGTKWRWLTRNYRPMRPLKQAWHWHRGTINSLRHGT